MWGILVFFFIKNLVFSRLLFYFSFLYLLFILLLDFSWPKIFSFFGLLDSVNVGLIFLTVMIMYLMNFEYSTRWLFMKIKVLGVFLILCFLVSDLFLFYVFFELSLLPTTYMIFSWGVQPERLSAAVYFLFYALMGSFPLLMNMINFVKNKGAYIFSLKFFSKTVSLVNFMDNNYLNFFWVFSFLMKLPIYSLHLWLPKAHVEAPVYGSMVLAAVLLKLGGYGLIRLGKFGLISSKYFLFWVVLSSVIVGLVTVRQNDIKSLMAYSSICHMAFTIVFFFYLNLLSFWAASFMLMGHGFISSGTFHSFNMIYSNSHSRKIFLKKGKKKNSKIFYFIFFFLLCLKSSLPMNITFFSELILSLFLYLMNYYFLVVFFLSVFLVGLFKMNLFLITNQGKILKSLKKSYSLSKFLTIFISLYHMLMNFFFVLSLLIFF